MMKMNRKKTLLIDAGNSRLKWSSLEHGQLSLQTAIAYSDSLPINCYNDLINTAQKEHGIIVLVSVLGQTFIDQARELSETLGFAFYSIESLAQLGKLKNAYHTPGQLGADRFVAIFAADAQNAGKDDNTIVIDCGTAVTIDAIAANGQHLGGLILPGQNLCTTSLLKGTAQLELNAEKTTTELLAKDTHQAILSGSYYGIVGAIEHICSCIEKRVFAENKQQKCTKIICGGGAEALLPQLPSGYRHVPDLLMQGLKIISEKHLDLWENPAQTRLQ